MRKSIKGKLHPDIEQLYTEIEDALRGVEEGYEAILECNRGYYDYGNTKREKPITPYAHESTEK